MFMVYVERLQEIISRIIIGVRLGALVVFKRKTFLNRFVSNAARSHLLDRYYKLCTNRCKREKVCANCWYLRFFFKFHHVLFIYWLMVLALDLNAHRYCSQISNIRLKTIHSFKLFLQSLKGFFQLSNLDVSLTIFELVLFYVLDRKKASQLDTTNQLVYHGLEYNWTILYNKLLINESKFWL